MKHHSHILKRHLLALLLPLLLWLSACDASSFPAGGITTTPAPGTTLSVHFIDVGQADAALLLCGGESMLIDGGNVGDSSLLVSYLADLGVDDIDHVVCTHAHEDHVGGLSGPLSQYTAGAVYCPVTEFDSKAFGNFLKYTEAQGLAPVRPAPGDQWTLGGALVTVLGPIAEEPVSVNDTSIVLRVDFGETSFLFTGDAELPSENDLLEASAPLEATVLKVGHHGSSSSTGYLFLREVNPSYAVISCGTDNSYGHPHDEVMSRLRDAEVQVYRTDLQGHIVAVSDGVAVTFETEKNQDADTNPGASAPGAYIGNVNSKVFHRPDCASLPAERNQIALPSRQEAVDGGYTPCGSCKP